MLLASDKIASMITAAILKGIDNSQMTGHSTSTNIAKGQHTANKIAHKIIVSSTFMVIFPLCLLVHASFGRYSIKQDAENHGMFQFFYADFNNTSVNRVF
jgi:hypothetical protein